MTSRSRKLSFTYINVDKMNVIFKLFFLIYLILGILCWIIAIPGIIRVSLVALAILIVLCTLTLEFPYIIEKLNLNGLHELISGLLLAFLAVLFFLEVLHLPEFRTGISFLLEFLVFCLYCYLVFPEECNC